MTQFMKFGYQKKMLTQDQLHHSAGSFAAAFQYWWQLWKCGHIYDFEFCTIYLFYYQWLRCPERPFMGFHHAPMGSLQYYTSDLTLGEVWRQAQKYFKFSVKEKTLGRWPLSQPLMIFFNQLEMTGLPRAGLASLLHWQEKKFPLILMDTVPSSREVVAEQSRGERCVTAFLQEYELRQYFMNDRDPMSFLFHDLMHAAHFMTDPLQYQSQIQFAKKILQVYNSDMVQFYYQRDYQFRYDFEYLSSDMNGHPQFLLQNLKSIFHLAFDRRPYVDTPLFEDFWSQFLFLWEM